MNKTIRLEVLTEVEDERQVFDHLIKVRREDTEEVGLLLCSHCCRWPESQVAKATWLEGCYTPHSMEGDPRLLLGYHPGTLTEWNYYEEQDKLFIEVSTHYGSGTNYVCTEEWDGEQEYIDIDFPSVWYIGDNSRTSRRRYLERLFERSMRDRSIREGLQAFFRSVEGTFGRSSDCSDWVAAFYTSWQIVYTEVHDCIIQSISQPLYENCEVFLDHLEVVIDNPDEGYERPQCLYKETTSRDYSHRRNRRRVRRVPQLTVLVPYGQSSVWAEGSKIPLIYDTNNMCYKVMVNNISKGYAKALEIEDHVLDSLIEEGEEIEEVEEIEE